MTLKVRQNQSPAGKFLARLQTQYTMDIFAGFYVLKKIYSYDLRTKVIESIDF